MAGFHTALLVFSATIVSVYGLTCLSCTDISQPRHCKIVKQCAAGEICAVESKTLAGETVYDVGCMHTSKCHNSSLMALWDGSCRQCCYGDLCNAAGCSEPGYPMTRGPVCYNCPLKRTPGSCHAVEICNPGQVCRSRTEMEFGDRLFSSSCTSSLECRDYHLGGGGAIIGRSVSVSGHSRDKRSLVTCERCCDQDLCNQNCNQTPVVHSHCSPNPCVYGSCVDTGAGYYCNCSSDYTGQNCTDRYKSHCSPNPCVYGSCVDTGAGYYCNCSSDYTGRNCTDRYKSHCFPNPCVYGSCVDTGAGYYCNCSSDYTGQNCTDRNKSHCSPNPCVYGSCVDTGAGYYCNCSSDYTGQNCTDRYQSNCFSNPCINGICVDIGIGYVCNCSSGYHGMDCTESYNKSGCDSNPCMYGTCHDSGLGMGYKCNCSIGYLGKHCERPSNYSDCLEIKQLTNTTLDGIYTIYFPGYGNFVQVYCDMNTDGGGWTVFQMRFDGSVNFTRKFDEYRGGFGSVYGEHWLGLKYIRALTENGTSELRLNLTAADNATAYELFQNFYVGPGTDYVLHLDHGTGTAGDSDGLYYNSGHKFVTIDQYHSNNCPEKDYGGWWYYNCAYANLNGDYITPGTRHPHRSEAGVTYYNFRPSESLKETVMMVRRTS